MCDRPPTNIEMVDYIHHKWDEHYAKVDRDGCCNKEIKAGGICPETGRMCPMYREAMRVEKATFKKVTT
jgi:hypothetical protein